MIVQEIEKEAIVKAKRSYECGVSEAITYRARTIKKQYGKEVYLSNVDTPQRHVLCLTNKEFDELFEVIKILS
jgi:hypothetical protein